MPFLTPTTPVISPPGWCDVPLTKRGESEARAAGLLLAERGYRTFDAAFTSELDRARRTCEIALEAADATGRESETVFVHASWKLNERHYGALQGRRKDDPDLVRTYGKETIARWRRGFDAAPPAMTIGHRHWRPAPAPLTESLADCQARVLDHWRCAISPYLKAGSAVLLTAHSNTIRAIVSFLDNVPKERVPNIRIPNGVPCVYLLDPLDGLKPILPSLRTDAGGSGGRWLFSAENSERLRDRIGGTRSFARAVFEAWDANGDGELSVDEVGDGLRDIMGADDTSIAAIASKILEEIDQDGSETLDLLEFETHADKACRKFIPDLFVQNDVH